MVSRIEGHVIEFDLEVREVFCQGLPHTPQVIFLMLARVVHAKYVKGQLLVPSAVLMRNQNDALQFVGVNEKAQPLPHCPGELWKVLDERQTLRTPRKREQIVVAVEPQTVIKKIVQPSLKTMVTAMNN